MLLIEKKSDSNCQDYQETGVITRKVHYKMGKITGPEINAPPPPPPDRLYGLPRQPRLCHHSVRAVIKYREGGYKMDACLSVVIISNLPFSRSRSRGEYLRVVGILEMVEYIGIYI